jgi:hypothetical protein
MIDEPEYKYLSLRNQSSTVALQQLRYAVISAEYGSFRRAAEAVLMRQSTLSRCTRQLEESIGVTVFERDAGSQAGPASGRLAVGAAASRRRGTAAGSADLIASRTWNWEQFYDGHKGSATIAISRADD